MLPPPPLWLRLWMRARQTSTKLALYANTVIVCALQPSAASASAFSSSSCSHSLCCFKIHKAHGTGLVSLVQRFYIYIYVYLGVCFFLLLLLPIFLSLPFCRSPQSFGLRTIQRRTHHRFVNLNTKDGRRQRFRCACVCVCAAICVWDYAQYDTTTPYYNDA